MVSSWHDHHGNIPRHCKKCGVIYEEFQHFAGHIQYKKCEDALRDETPGSTFVPAEHRGKKTSTRTRRTYRRSYTARTPRYRKRRTMPKRRILNLTSRKKRDQMAPISNMLGGSPAPTAELRAPALSRPPRTVSYRCSFGSQPQERPKTSATAPDGAQPHRKDGSHDLHGRFVRESAVPNKQCDPVELA